MTKTIAVCLLLLFFVSHSHPAEVTTSTSFPKSSTLLPMNSDDNNVGAKSLEKIFCDSMIDSAAGPTSDEEVFNYDCSSRDLNWFSLQQLIDHIRASTSLNLAYNSLGAHSPVIRNLTFNLFKELKRLNLSSNGLKAAESHAFFFMNAITDTIDTTFLQFLDPSQLHPLKLVSLDLSRNEFERIPWSSLRSLPHLTVLYLDHNPIRAFDLGDWLPVEPPPASDTLAELIDYDDIDSVTEGESSARLKFFRNLTEIYARSSQIERVDPLLFAYLVKLRRLDLADNQIRHLSVDLRRPLESLPMFESLYVDDNPLVCDCHLIWLKEFFKLKQQQALKRGGRGFNFTRVRGTFCEINTKTSKKNLIVETKVIYINSTYKANENYFKLTNINHLNNDNRARTINKSSNSTNNPSFPSLKFVGLNDLSADQFYCNLDLSGQVKDLTLLSEHAHYRQEIEITCRVQSFPEAKIKWLFGQRDLDKMFTYENKQFTTIDSRDYNATQRLFTVDSKLLVSYSGHIGKVNFSCRAFYLTPMATADGKLKTPQPAHLLKSIQFNINSDDDQFYIDAAAAAAAATGEFPDDYLVNSTMLMMKEANHRSGHERSIVYWLFLGISVLFALLVVVFVVVFVIRHYTVKKRKQREAEASHYAYSTYTTSNYSTINKRSAIYLNQPNQHHHGSKQGVMTDLSSSSSAMIPLKPDVIREHKEHNSIYYRSTATNSSNTSSHSPNDYSTPNTIASNGGGGVRSTPVYSTDTTPVIYTVEPGRTLRSVISRTTGPTTPSTTEESVSSTSSCSSSSSSKRDSARSSKSFEENIDEYLEPEGPDLSKPQPKTPKSSSNSPTNL